MARDLLMALALQSVRGSTGAYPGGRFSIALHHQVRALCSLSFIGSVLLFALVLSFRYFVYLLAQAEALA